MDSALEERKLLFVEDDAETRGLLEKLLRKKYPHLTLYVASNGAEGLALFNEHHPQLVITDISMPVMSGIEMAEAIRESSSVAIIVAMTAHTDGEYLARANQLGISRYITKPIQFKELFTVIDQNS